MERCSLDFGNILAYQLFALNTIVLILLPARCQKKTSAQVSVERQLGAQLGDDNATNPTSKG